MFQKATLSLCAVCFTISSLGLAPAAEVSVTVSNIAPAGGNYVTPVWVGFHDGSFDSYNGGAPSQPGIERIAEDGNVTPISDDFRAGLTYVDSAGASATVSSSQAGSERVDGVIANGAPIAPGETATARFNVDVTGANQYFSYASMVLPSNDYYIANGNPTAIDLSPLDGAPIGTSIAFKVGLSGTVNDAGTEVNDFATSAGNPLFGLAPGQSGPNEGADENGVNTKVITPYSDFLNTPADFLATSSELKFNNSALYPDGIATITITTVPEPAANALLLSVPMLFGLRRRRRRATK